MRKFVPISIMLASIIATTACSSAGATESKKALDTTTTIIDTTEVATTEPVITTVTTTELARIAEPEETSRDMFIWEGTKITGLTKEGKELTYVIIPDGTTEISAESNDKKGFRKSKVQKLVIPETVTNIDSETFKYCDDLSEVVISENAKMQNYDDWFVSDHKIKELRLPEGLTIINSAFHINSLESIVIPSTVTTLPDCLLGFDIYSSDIDNGVTISKEVHVYTSGDNISKIGNFDNKEYIESLISNKDENHNSRRLFEELQKVLLPSYVENIDYYTIENPEQLSTIYLHCDKGSLWDKIFSEASWVVMEYNDASETTDNA